MTKFNKLEDASARPWTLHRPHNRSLLERYSEKVDKRGPDDCWPWLAAKDIGGYGVINNERGCEPRKLKAHRLAYSLEFGDIPEELIVRHVVCANPACCNPAHLAVGSHADNSEDMIRDGHSILGDRHPSKIDPRGWRESRKDSISLTEELVLEIRRRYSEGEGPRSIASDLGLGRIAVQFAAIGRTWADVPNAQPRQGRKTRFTAELVRQVRADHLVNRSRKAAAEKFGLTVDEITHLRSRDRWKNVLP